MESFEEDLISRLVKVINEAAKSQWEESHLPGGDCRLIDSWFLLAESSSSDRVSPSAINFAICERSIINEVFDAGRGKR